MQYVLRACSGSNPTGKMGAGVAKEDAFCHVGPGGHAPEAPRDGISDAKAWAQILAWLECGPSGCLQLGAEDVPHDLGPGHRDLIHQALDRNKSIRCLTIGDVSSQCARLFGESLQGLTHVTEIKFTGTRADDALAKLLGVLLMPVWVTTSVLRALVIANSRRNMLTDRGGIAIARALEENTSLQTLVLFGTLLGDGAATALTAALEHNKTMTVLVFYGKALSGSGITAFADFFRRGSCPMLKEFAVGGTEFRDRSAQVLTQAVAARRKSMRDRGSGTPRSGGGLQKFGLLSAVLGDESVAAVHHVLHTGLVELSLLLGKLTDAGVVALVEAIRHPPADAIGEAPRGLALASASAGDSGLAAFEVLFKQGAAASIGAVELAFGSATSQAAASILLTSQSTSSTPRTPRTQTAQTSAPSCTTAPVAPPVEESSLRLSGATVGVSSTGAGNSASASTGGVVGAVLPERSEVGTVPQCLVGLRREGNSGCFSQARLSVSNKFADYLEEVLFARLLLRSDPITSP
eukprot:TRINITY_DN50546_c0_g1_i2.p1 TRINITY_DN50546_c0_g1~~TRINITY_DN50546_c0_g1_i2.p1  ORF type:complete len:542 (+),score=80.03 TRINITY_DN50546_c0_g1_i2:65-1627(+)